MTEHKIDDILNEIATLSDKDIRTLRKGITDITKQRRVHAKKPLVYNREFWSSYYQNHQNQIQERCKKYYHEKVASVVIQGGRASGLTFLRKMFKE